MSLDLASAQDAISQFFHPFMLRVPGRFPAASSPCGYAAQGGAITAADGTRVKSWTATITLPARSTLELAGDEQVTIDQHPGRTYVVVHAPGPNAINLERAYGVQEL